MWYVGINFVGGQEQRTLFKYEDEPTARTHGDKFDCAVGPFGTKRGAQFFVEHLGIHSVDEAEKAARN